MYKKNSTVSFLFDFSKQLSTAEFTQPSQISYLGLFKKIKL